MRVKNTIMNIMEPIKRKVIWRRCFDVANTIAAPRVARFLDGKGTHCSVFNQDIKVKFYRYIYDWGVASYNGLIILRAHKWDEETGDNISETRYRYYTEIYVYDECSKEFVADLIHKELLTIYDGQDDYRTWSNHEWHKKTFEKSEWIERLLDERILLSEDIMDEKIGFLIKQIRPKLVVDTFLSSRYS